MYLKYTLTFQLGKRWLTRRVAGVCWLRSSTDKWAGDEYSVFLKIQGKGCNQWRYCIKGIKQKSFSQSPQLNSLPPDVVKQLCKWVQKAIKRINRRKLCHGLLKTKMWLQALVQREIPTYCQKLGTDAAGNITVCLPTQNNLSLSICCRLCLAKKVFGLIQYCWFSVLVKFFFPGVFPTKAIKTYVQ